MNQETMMILKMVDEGKITSDEAVKLIKTVKDKNTMSIELDEKMKKVGNAVDKFAKDVKEKVGSMAKEAEPVVKDITCAVVDKTTEITTELGKAIKDIFEEKNSKTDNDDAIDDEIEILEMGGDDEESIEN